MSVTAGLEGLLRAGGVAIRRHRVSRSVGTRKHAAGNTHYGIPEPLWLYEAKSDALGRALEAE